MAREAVDNMMNVPFDMVKRDMVSIILMRQPLFILCLACRNGHAFVYIDAFGSTSLQERFW